ncbi:hypothetical protein OSB04_031280 [Centaurea solstitialis]|uniref:Protein kinase domain-containing protein n=1 Tax=Centaurea solstitialis TaxID=347529 RepID=A0AA38VXF8_9ASTR|nr:hypothetical protein OSB04_031280 [Centaurea solstitialis]
MENEDGLDYLRIPYEKIKFGNKLEVQGYGTVFDGEFDNRRVALKQLNITNLGNVKPKLLAEIETIARFRRHPNLVALLGFCDEKSNEITLVYEFVSSGNLADKMRKRLNTIQRLEICLGAARGLDYLHTGVDVATPGITHGNIKLSKILLNSDSNAKKFEAKVSSFGLSKILPGKSQKVLEPTVTTKESDVYAFGVLLLEVLCGVSELVDTDDYQERHVTELVPKRLEQNKLRKIVHFDIRKEIKEESLETYAKIACRCVVESPEERPSMAEVVKELEKALRQQGGEVSDVQIVGEEDGNGVIVESELDVAEKVDDNKVSITSASSESTNCAPEEDHSMGDRSIPTPISYNRDEESVSDGTHTEGAKKESNDDLEATSSEEIIGDLNSNEKSKINGEWEDETQSKIVSTPSESSNGDTNAITDHSLNQEVQDPGLMESGSDEMERLRIPYDKIKFGNKIDILGYGTMFEGEFDHQQVALKRLNITNLGHIKPNLLAEILTIARFRHHPNLVALLGFCDEKSNEIVLVYEYVSSGNLADRMIKHLTTIQRLEICLGAARGLDHLHTGVDSTPGIVHGDIKLSKILLSSRTSPSEFEAKVSGFGLSRLIPGQSRKTLDPTDKESDVYSFGVVLLEVLCGVRELVDTDDYQERDVTELVPKKMEQKMLRPIVHIDIREEITTESLETYARIACLCVMKDPKQRPTMAQVVEELEKALKLQGKEPSDVHILGSSNGNGLPEMNEDDHKRDDDCQTVGSNIAEKNYDVQETIDDPISSERLDLSEANNADEERSINTSSEDTNGVKNAAENITTGTEASDSHILGGSNGNGLPEETINEDGDGPTIGSNISEKNYDVQETIDDPISSERLDLSEANNEDEGRSINSSSEDTNGVKNAAEDIATQGSKDGESGSTNDPESTEEIVGDVKSIEETNITENEVNDGSKITTISSESNNGDGTKEDDVDTKKENADDKNRATEISMDGQSSAILDSDGVNTEKENANSALLNFHDTDKKPELITGITERDFKDFATNDFKSVKESESKPSDSISTSSESSDGEGTTPSDYLLQKSPANGPLTIILYISYTRKNRQQMAPETVVRVPGGAASPTGFEID